MRKTLGAIFALLLLTTGIVAFTPQAASAAAARNPSLIINGYVEDGCLSANYSNSYIADCGSGSRFHLWRRVALPLGGFRLQNNGSGLCLAMNEGLDVFVTNCSSATLNPYQDWQAAANSGTWTNIRHRASGACMSANGMAKDTYGVRGGCNFDADGRKWLFS
ncbi:ricin-type beta-trefoil lectin domain protein [Cryptosporangium aurantiacum]|uniref:Ricin-type beta-trefoil lectin domain-containing protein n=1 Tax=Cryptosporangium aurantiacum TaxID=134849 RepID=A0A1M7RB09_9ACTN|nr:ricin-type beta-trefoil lectin domain protein [Cryptosporangium aurantiacum]SHN43248.1 Ricin-type beta-trefoil lectin domain-containing protein [Cryptosporangium aurantiacum]